jgi:hypothetical protein
MLPRLFPIFLTLAVSSAALAEDWPGWRGPRHDGTSLEKELPTRWGKDDNIAWKTPIPGVGHSSPIFWGDRIFVTTCVEMDKAPEAKKVNGQRQLLCLDRINGKILWTRTVLECPLERKHGLNSYASSTPVTDGKYVVVAFLDENTMQVACYDFDGKEVWKKSPGQFTSVHGFCSSPVIFKDTVIFNGDQDNPKAFLVAFDKATGEERWRTKRPGVRSYTPPIIVDVAGKPQLVFSGSKCVASYNPENGEEIWKIDGPTEQFVASLVMQDGILCLTAGFPTFHIMGIKPDGQGNVTKSHVAWHHDFEANGNEASYVPSPIAVDKYFLVVSDTGFLHCLDVKSGDRLWKEKLGKHHSASPIAACGLAYYTSDNGTTYVVRPGAKCEIVAQNKLDEDCRASPAVSHGQIFIRTIGNLYCIGK